MKKIFILFFILFINNVFATEIINNVSVDKKTFGDWNVSCDEDVMLDSVECQIFSTFYNDTSSIYIQPNNKIANQVVIMIPSVIEGTNVKFKVDKNSIINSDIVDTITAYGVIPFSPENQKKMFNQLKMGDTLYIRFSVRDLKSKGGIKEITTKISLLDFQKTLLYYDTKIKK